MIKVTHNKEDNIIRIEKSGTYNVNDAINMLQLLVERYGDFDCAYILEDSQTTKYDMSLKDLSTLLSAVKKELTGLKEVRHADLVSSPLETAISFLYAQIASLIPNYDYRAFSTEEAAIKWLKKGTHYNK